MASRKSKSDQEREKVIQNRLQELLTRMLQDEDNKYCVDCDAKGPRWVSWNLGIFVCIRCAGIHRNLGVHISKVKSVNLDSWTPHQVACMQIMGNSKARAVYEANVPEGFRRPQTDAQLDTFIRAKYEKKKYIAREWVPVKAPEFPEGWTALIEAEKQKKDIRTIVLPSHTNHSSEESVKRERQSPKETVATSKTDSKIETVASKTSSPLESNFDLLSLSSQQSSIQPAVKPLATSKSSSIANDLLCLAGNDNSSEFDDFIGASSQKPATNNSNSSQNGTPQPSSNQALFEDFTVATEEKNSTMSKDSIMALFNQKPAPQVAPLQQPQFMGLGNLHIPQAASTGAVPMQIPANFGVPGNFTSSQQQQLPMGGGFANNMNPFLAMSATQSTSDQNNVFANTNRNFLQ